MRNTLKSVFLFSILIILGACSIYKPVTNKSDKTKLLILDPGNYHNVRFNPEWIVENNIETIIEREYLDGKDGKVHLVSILEYDGKGYLKTKFSGLSYPENDLPNKNDIFSRWEYKITSIDSFLVHSSKIIRFHNQNGKMEKPDTLQGGSKLYNLKNAKTYLNERGELLIKYIYDKSNRLTKELNAEGAEVLSIKYYENGMIEINKFSQWQSKDFSSFIFKDKNGRIIKNVDESNNMTHEFIYDDNGFMVEVKHWFEGNEPNYHKYEYVRRDSR